MAGYGPTIGLNDVVEIQLITEQSPQVGINSLHYLVTQAPGGAGNSLGDMVAALVALGVGAKYAALLVSGAKFRGYNSRRVAGVPSIYYPESEQVAGTVAGDPLPGQVSGFLRKRVEVPGRRKGGRVYVAFPGEADNDTDGTPTAGYITRLTTLRTALFSALSFGTTGVALPCVWHPATTIPPTPAEARLLYQLVVVDQWATQRRRGSFGKKNVPPI